MQALMDKIAAHLHEGGEWCSLEKAHTLASIVCGLKPSIVVEIGVWMGGSLVPMAMAAKHIENCHVTAIDPWAKQESVKGMSPSNANWWGQVNHESAYQRFCERLTNHGLRDVVSVWRVASDDAPEIKGVGLLHVDGNHSEQALRDVEHYAPNVVMGGIVVMDDIEWEGGGVAKGVKALLSLGFEKLYNLGSGAVYQRRNWIMSGT